MLIGTLTTGVGISTTINLQWLPQYIYYAAATQLTSLKVTVQGDGVILDLDATGLNDLSATRRFGNVTNGVMIPLADGIIKNKTVELAFINSAAQTPAIYGFSLKNGRAYIQTLRETVLASSGTVVKDFAVLGFSTIAANDELTIKFRDGHVQRMTGAEVLIWLSLVQNGVTYYSIDNIEAIIEYVHFIPAANAVVYKTRYLPIGDVI